MPLENDVIVNELKEQGISETLATGLNFETSEELTEWVNEFKNAMPNVKSITDYSKEDIEELAKDPAFKGAKGLQGYIDSIRQKSIQKPIKPLEPKKVELEIPEEFKTQLEDLKAMKDELAAERFEKKVRSKAKLAELDENAISKVLKMVKVGDDDSVIDAEIADMKTFLNELGFKSLGNPSGGKNTKQARKSIDEWVAKEKAKKEKFNKK